MDDLNSRFLLFDPHLYVSSEKLIVPSIIRAVVDRRKQFFSHLLIDLAELCRSSSHKIKQLSTWHYCQHKAYTHTHSKQDHETHVSLDRVQNIEKYAQEFMGACF